MTAAPPSRIPSSTYRLQLRQGFTLNDARDLVPYLARLGISDLYLSPLFKAVPGSSHGYDICDHGRVNPELGGEKAFDALCSSLKKHGMGLILDVVPNHMAAHATANPWWRDVLENGPSSSFAGFFDIDWNPLKPELKNKILLPILGDQYGHALERGELRLGLREGSLYIAYFEHDLPVNSRSAAAVLDRSLDGLKARFPADDPALGEFLSIKIALANLAPLTERLPAKIEERDREKETCRRRLKEVLENSAPLRSHMDKLLRVINGRPGEPGSFDDLHALLQAQAYRLAYWRTALDEINYRRFFDINSLAGLRQENPDAFQRSHAVLARWAQEGKVTGLRIDHVDGLYDPEDYLTRLQALLAGQPPAGSAPIYVTVEKILSLNEQLPQAWPAHGTTGYDFLNDLNGVFVQSSNALAFKKFYGRFTARMETFGQTAYESKFRVMVDFMVSELNVLAQALNRLSEEDRRSRDFTLETLRRALREIVAAFPLYRTYAGPRGASSLDEKAVDAALAKVRLRHPTIEPSILLFVRDHLIPAAQDGDGYLSRRKLDFAMKFQQYTAPVQAKGVEDTAFYRHFPLLSLNEVGGDPQRFGRSLKEFHEANLQRAVQRPFGLLATATHDTKRGEDARARINVLSEIPEEWRRKVMEWSRLNASHRAQLNGAFAPDRNEEYFIYQTLIGAWPADAGESGPANPAEFLERMQNYLAKAMREAKVHTSWINNNAPYEKAVLQFIEKILAGPRAPRFLSSFAPFARRVAFHGALNSLSQVALKAASPGVPDFYQGAELWDLNLADPDNRRPVDFARRAGLLEELEPLLLETTPPRARAAALQALLDNWPDGRIKFFVTQALLRARSGHPDLFARGDYTPLSLEGPWAGHFIAFARRYETERLAVVAPRWSVSLAAGPGTGISWDKAGDTRLLLPAGWQDVRLRNAFTGEESAVSPEGGPILLEPILRNFPLALLLDASPSSLGPRPRGSSVDLSLA